MLRRVITVGVTIVLCLALAELTLRLAKPQLLSMRFPQLENGMRVAPANSTGRVTLPPLSDVRVHFNAQRFRDDRDFGPVPPPGRTRIAILGDSFVFGWGAEAAQSFPAQLEAILRARGQDVEVINAGVPGQSMGEKVLWYREAVAPLRPNIVVLTLLVDDVDGENGLHLFDLQGGAAVPLPVPRRERTNGLRRIPGYDFLFAHSHLLSFLRRAWGNASRGSQHRVFVADADVAANRAAFTHDGLPLLTAEIRWLRDQVVGSGGRLIVVHLPVRESIYPSADSVARQSRWKEAAMAASVAAICHGERIPYLDLTAGMRRAASASPQQLYYRGGDTHPNPRGYRAFAELTASSGVVP